MKAKAIIGSDHRGFNLKNQIVSEFGFEDCGTYSSERCNYTDIVPKVITKRHITGADFGILICGSGIGVSILANRNNNIRAVVCHDERVAIISREHSDANILCLGSDFIDIDCAIKIISTFISTPFLAKEPYISRLRVLDTTTNC